jgi:hypothetical protein
MSSHHDATETYRLVITRRDATEILLTPSGKDWTLPRVEIRKQQRIAEQLSVEAGKAWGLETYCLFVPGSHTNEDTTCAVMECVKHNEKAPLGKYWMPVSVAGEYMEGEEAAAVQDAFAEMASYTRGEKPGPFAKPGWMRELFRWVHEQTARLGVRLTGNLRQYNASPTFSLLRIETDGAALWFKATGVPNSHELPVSVLLARLFPRHVPRILGVHPAWNGWLSTEASGTALDEISDCSAWERVAKELAELQIASIGKSAELLERKCKDLRLPEIVKFIDPFLSRVAELMTAQEKRSPAPLTNSELASLGEGLKEACSLLESFDLPDSLGHIDFNPGNIFVSADRCTFLDWAEGCVSNPLITFEYLREHIQRGGIQAPSAVERLTAAYARPWMSFYSPDDLKRALTVSPLIAVFVYAVANDSWSSSDSPRNPGFAGYLRSLTRRMYREAIHVAERSELCLD